MEQKKYEKENNIYSLQGVVVEGIDWLLRHIRAEIIDTVHCLCNVSFEKK